MTHPSDSIVVQRVIAGDVEAFALLVDRHHGRLARYAFHLLGSDAEAEEAVQDSFVRAYRSLATYKEQELFGAWIMRILVNRCRTRLVRERRREETAAAWLRENDEPFEPFEPSDHFATRDELSIALAQLPAEQREAVVLRYADELGYDEISSITGAGISALKMRVKRGCERLRAILEASRAGPEPFLSDDLRARLRAPVDLGAGARARVMQRVREAAVLARIAPKPRGMARPSVLGALLAASFVAAIVTGGARRVPAATRSRRSPIPSRCIFRSGGGSRGRPPVIDRDRFVAVADETRNPAPNPASQTARLIHRD